MMTNLGKRTFTGIILVILTLASVWLGPYSFTVLMMLINTFALYEFYRLLEIPGARPQLAAGMIISNALIACWLAILTDLVNFKWIVLIIPLAYGPFINVLYRPVKKPLYGLAATFLGVIFISLPLCFFIALPFLPGPMRSFHREIPIGFFLLLWVNDTIAYLVGSHFGKHSLFKRVSPHKSWEGSFAGAALSLITAYILSQTLTIFNAAGWLGLSLVVIISGTYGDLIKSLLKRSAGVKDSGTLLPGHGGVLDRFDSLLGSAPFAFIYLLLLKL